MKMMIFAVLLIAALFLAACGGGNPEPTESPAAAAQLPEGDAAAGEKTYGQLCVACHGPGGVGVEGLGKAITTSEFVADHSDAELVAFIEEGRDISHPDNTTGVPMPPKGGNPALSQEDIVNIVAYMRSIQE